eukprot:340103-Pyramimonas_sp.AAC.1
MATFIKISGSCSAGIQVNPEPWVGARFGLPFRLQRWGGARGFAGLLRVGDASLPAQRVRFASGARAHCETNSATSAPDHL